jgi:DNA-binding IclR family transcriptional regulator
VRDADGVVMAAVSVSGPSFRMGPQEFPRIARRLTAGADELSRRLGYFG